MEGKAKKEWRPGEYAEQELFESDETATLDEELDSPSEEQEICNTTVRKTPPTSEPDKKASPAVA